MKYLLSLLVFVELQKDELETIFVCCQKCKGLHHASIGPFVPQLISEALKSIYVFFA